MTVQSNQCSPSNLESITICSHYEMYLPALLSSCSPPHFSISFSRSLDPLKLKTRLSVRQIDTIDTKRVSGRFVRLYIESLIQWNDAVGLLYISSSSPQGTPGYDERECVSYYCGSCLSQSYGGVQGTDLRIHFQCTDKNTREGHQQPER